MYFIYLLFCSCVGPCNWPFGCCVNTLTTKNAIIIIIKVKTRALLQTENTVEVRSIKKDYQNYYTYIMPKVIKR